MIAVIKGDIIASRKINDPERWLIPLKNLLGKWGSSPRQWELVWGDFFQIEIENPADSLRRALEIKALIKSISPNNLNKKIGPINVRMAIGIGEKKYSAQRISESNGPAFVYSGDKFEKLKKEKRNLAVQSCWPDFDDEINLYLKLTNTFMDNWSVSSAELMRIVLQSPEATQEEIGKALGIKQNSVSGRWNRAKIDEIMEVEHVFRKKLKNFLQ